MKKVVVGATTSPSAFSFAVSSGGGTHAFEADGQNQLTLPAGTYSVTEPAVSGWTTTYAGCSNVVLSSTQSTVPTCTITNTKQEAPAPPPPNPKLNVKKVVVGATTSPSAFSFAVSSGGGTHAFEADGQNQLTLPAGTYSVTEPAVSGWTTTYAGCSNVVLSSTQSTVPTCTITNTKQEAPAPPPPCGHHSTDGARLGDGQGDQAEEGVLSWTASTDNVGVKAYGVYRDGVLTSTQKALSATFDDLECGTSYTVAVDAQDHAGNRSEKTVHRARRPEPASRLLQRSRRITTGRTSRTSRTIRTSPISRSSRRTPRARRPSTPSEGSAARTRSAPKPTSEPVGSSQTAAGRSVGADDRSLPESFVPSDRPLWTSLPAWNPMLVDVFGWLASSVYVELGEAKPASRPVLGRDGRIVQRLESVQHHGEQAGIGLLSLGQRSWVSAADDLISVRWDGRRFFTRGALKLHLDWSGESYNTWVRQHRKAFQRLPE